MLDVGRQFRRMFVRFEGEGLRDRRLGVVSPRRADAAEIGRMCSLYRYRYRDFKVTFQRNPNRFVNKEPEPPQKPTAVWINPPNPEVNYQA